MIHRLALPLLVPGIGGLLFSQPISAQIRSGSCNEYRGTIGEHTEIGLALYAGNGSLQGSYFYKKDLKDITLAGKFTSARDISLTGTDSAGQSHGEFQLHFAEHRREYETTKSLEAEVLEGKWTSADRKTSDPVYLQLDHECVPPGQKRYESAGASSDELVERNAQAFYDAVVGGKPERAARYVAYPATYFEGGKRKQISNPAEFLKLYKKIFTPTYVAEIAKGIAHHMFVSAQGIMIADGKVWFDADGKAKHFNNQVQ